MKKIIHWSLWHLKRKDASACGINLELAGRKVGASVDPKDVTCKKCKKTKVFKEIK